MAARRDRSEEMRRALEEWRASGTSLWAYAQEHRLPYSTLRYWRRREEGGLAAPLESRRPKSTTADPARFVEVSPVSISLMGSRGCVVRLPGGIEIEAPAGFDPEELARFVAALRSC